jgi:hypothetical protein
VKAIFQGYHFCLLIGLSEPFVGEFLLFRDAPLTDGAWLIQHFYSSLEKPLTVYTENAVCSAVSVHYDYAFYIGFFCVFEKDFAVIGHT